MPFLEDREVSNTYIPLVVAGFVKDLNMYRAEKSQYVTELLQEHSTFLPLALSLSFKLSPVFAVGFLDESKLNLAKVVETLIKVVFSDFK